MLAVVTLVVSAVLMSGCLGGKKVDTSPQPAQTEQRPVNLSRIKDPWKGPAEKLSRRGFTQAQLEAVFNSPNLEYTSAPMAAKLKELYPIFYRSERTREIQEKLYQLGYDLIIDGRGGAGTQKAVKRFQADNNLAVNGETSDATLAAINRVMKNKKLRPLSGYSAPPAAKPSRTQTYAHFTSADNLAKIRAYYNEDRAQFQRMARQYQVPGEVAAAIMWVETRYGTFMGKHKAASNLASMAAAASSFSVVEKDVEELIKQDAGARAFLVETAQARGDWALNELAALMTYSFDNGHDPTTFMGSIYGAIGWGQFMPSNVRQFGVDGNGDGKVDLFDKTDAIFSIGNFLKNHGWKPGAMTEDERRAVIMKYNKSGVYVNTVLYLADHLAKN
ncbi:lytic murein transglycosylase [Deltaproteobacteria bacterium OttesenSCG-928-K17]|nr:lytic murein transglycosylase [Deltaproteobacteria bacterium OttesenSCG-928-K17]